MFFFSPFANQRLCQGVKISAVLVSIEVARLSQVRALMGMCWV